MQPLQATTTWFSNTYLDFLVIVLFQDEMKHNFVLLKYYRDIFEKLTVLAIVNGPKHCLFSKLTLFKNA